jgi:hypothetical protein
LGLCDLINGDHGNCEDFVSRVFIGKVDRSTGSKCLESFTGKEELGCEGSR